MITKGRALERHKTQKRGKKQLPGSFEMGSKEMQDARCPLPSPSGPRPSALRRGCPDGKMGP
jgi:hypothetical protein